MAITPPNWSVRNGRLHRLYEFADFVEAFTFMTRCAFAAEAAGHHPDWRNVYNRVEVELITHDAGSLTARDYALARDFEAIYASMTGQGDDASPRT